MSTPPESLVTLRKTRSSLKVDSNMSPKEAVSRFTGSGNDFEKCGGFVKKCGGWDLNPTNQLGMVWKRGLVSLSFSKTLGRLASEEDGGNQGA